MRHHELFSPLKLSSLSSHSCRLNFPHPEPLPRIRPPGCMPCDSLDPWTKRLPTSPLMLHNRVASTTTRTTFTIFLLLSQAREIYCRIWHLGSRPTLRFEVLEGYQGRNDPFPTCFARRPEKCVQMGLGFVNWGTDMSRRPSFVAFAGRKKPGRWLLKLLPKRFRAQCSTTSFWKRSVGRPTKLTSFGMDSTIPLQQMTMKANSPYYRLLRTKCR